MHPACIKPRRRKREARRGEARRNGVVMDLKIEDVSYTRVYVWEECVVTSSGPEWRGTVLFIGSIKSRPHAGTSRVARMTFIMVKVARTMSLCFKADRMVFYVTEDVLQMYNIYIWERRGKKRKEKKKVKKKLTSLLLFLVYLTFFSSFFPFFLSRERQREKHDTNYTHISLPNLWQNPKLFIYIQCYTLKQKHIYIL